MNRKKKVIISVVSDLVTDQRVHRSAVTLRNNGYHVVLVGRKRRNSLSLGQRDYETKRFNLIFEKGPFFYACFNLRLLFYLLFHRADVYLSNDLDTLPANYLASKIKNVRLVYDSHEYFTEVPELVSRPVIQSVWKRIEQWIFPKLKYVMTVNDSIAGIYNREYKVPLVTVRNLPFTPDYSSPVVQRKDWGIPENKKVFLFQGAGINIDRGAEEAVSAIRNVEDAVLLFIGGGDVIEKIKKMSAEAGLNDKVFFIPKQPMNELIRYTRMADFGLTLDKDTNLNYRFSLPNKLFDYIHAQLPVLATDLPEVRKVVLQYDIGMLTPGSDPVTLSGKMNEMIHGNIDKWKSNLKIASGELCWEKEERKLLKLVADAS